MSGMTRRLPEPQQPLPVPPPAKIPEHPGGGGFKPEAVFMGGFGSALEK